MLCAGIILAGCSKSASLGSEDVMTLGDYSVIEIEQEYMDQIDDDFIQEYVDEMLAEYETTEITAEGTVEDGDDVYVSIVCTVNGEELSIGTTSGTTITVGTGEYMDTIEDALIGAEIGDTVEVSIEYSSDYEYEELAGETAYFTIEVLYITETITPDLDDDFVSEYSYEYWGEQIDTVDELYDYLYDYFYVYYLHTAIISELQETQVIKTYNEETYNILYEYASEELEYYAEYYETDVETLAVDYGYDDAEAYIEDETTYYADLIMLFNYLWDDLGFEDYTEEDLDEALEEYLEENGYSEGYTLEEFKETCSEAWFIIFEGINYKYDPVMEALEEFVVFVESE